MRYLTIALILFFIFSCSNKIEYKTGTIIRVEQYEGGFMTYGGPVSYVEFDTGHVKAYKAYWGRVDARVSCKFINGEPTYIEHNCKKTNP